MICFCFLLSEAFLGGDEVGKPVSRGNQSIILGLSSNCSTFTINWLAPPYTRPFLHGDGIIHMYILIRKFYAKFNFTVYTVYYFTYFPKIITPTVKFSDTMVENIALFFFFY